MWRTKMTCLLFILNLVVLTVGNTDETTTTNAETPATIFNRFVDLLNKLQQLLPKFKQYFAPPTSGNTDQIKPPETQPVLRAQRQGYEEPGVGHRKEEQDGYIDGQREPILFDEGSGGADDDLQQLSATVEKALESFPSGQTLLGNGNMSDILEQEEMLPVVTKATKVNAKVTKSKFITSVRKEPKPTLPVLEVTDTKTELSPNITKGSLPTVVSTMEATELETDNPMEVSDPPTPGMETTEMSGSENGMTESEVIESDEPIDSAEQEVERENLDNAHLEQKVERENLENPQPTMGTDENPDTMDSDFPTGPTSDFNMPLNDKTTGSELRSTDSTGGFKHPPEKEYDAEDSEDGEEGREREETEEEYNGETESAEMEQNGGTSQSENPAGSEEYIVPPTSGLSESFPIPDRSEYKQPDFSNPGGPNVDGTFPSRENDEEGREGEPEVPTMPGAIPTGGYARTPLLTTRARLNLYQLTRPGGRATDSPRVVRGERFWTPRCTRRGLNLPHPYSPCMFIRCEYFAGRRQDSSRSELLAQSYLCGPGTSVPRWFFSGLANPCLTENYLCE